MSKDAVQSRWKLLAGGVVISLIVRANNFVNLNEPNNPEVIGSFFGAATGGAILGWRYGGFGEKRESPRSNRDVPTRPLADARVFLPYCQFLDKF